ncbi:MAG: hypothetical protein NTZ05_12940, partial [Chloroflexi bacterium]|nr:hypothetical protein [Chloroflexota bacterium]
MSASPATPLSPGQDPSPAQSSAGLMAFLSSLFWVYSPDGKSRRIFPGWKEVMAGTAHSFFGYGFYLYSWSAIVAAMGKEFGWSA